MVAIVWPCAIDSIRTVLFIFSSRSWPTEEIKRNQSKIQAIQNHFDFTSLSLLISLLLNMLQAFHSKQFPHIQTIKQLIIRSVRFDFNFFYANVTARDTEASTQVSKRNQKRTGKKTFCKEAVKQIATEQIHFNNIISLHRKWFNIKL